MHTIVRRGGTLLAASALSLATLVAPTVPPAVAAEEHDAGPVTAGAGWLSGQLTDGLLSYPTDFGPFTDHGLSIDAALGLDAVGGHDATVRSISDAVGSDREAYVTGEAFGDADSLYAGPAAKALVLAQTAGADPATYGGSDLVDRVESVVSTDPVIAGRLEDRSSFGDYANVLGQAFAASGLTTAGSERAADATAYLLQQQCSEGFFRLDFTKDKTAVDQTCDGGKGAGESSPDTDATALVILLLQDLGVAPAIEESLARAESWLLDQQGDDGSFGGGTSTEAPNTNSTGVAGWALGERGQVEAAEDAAAWVRGHQTVNVGVCAPWAEGALGAIAYDDAALDEGRGDGITDGTVGQWLRASAQALPVLQWAPAVGSGGILVVDYFDYFNRAGVNGGMWVSDRVPGETVCAAHRGIRVYRAVQRNGQAGFSLPLPDRTARRTYEVYGADGLLATKTFRTLGELKIPFTLKKRVGKGAKQRLEVRGLERREQVRVTFRGKLVESRRVPKGGSFVVRFPVTGKVGKAKVKVIGHYPSLRRNAKTFKVTR